MWPLSQEWYGDRLNPDYKLNPDGKPTAELQGMLTRAGLTTDFWRLTR